MIITHAQQIATDVVSRKCQEDSDRDNFPDFYTFFEIRNKFN